MSQDESEPDCSDAAALTSARGGARSATGGSFRPVVFVRRARSGAFPSRSRGSSVSVYANHERVSARSRYGADPLLTREDPAVSGLIVDVLREEGVDVRLGTLAERVRRETLATNTCPLTW